MRILVLITLIYVTPAFSQSVHYRVTMPNPASHLFHIEIEIKDPGGESMNLGLPAWNATYVVRNFSQFLQGFDANVPVRRIDKQTWRMQPGTASLVSVRYTVYANQKSPFSSELNEQHAFFNGANLLLLWKEKRYLPVTLEIAAPPDWTVATSLPPTGRENVFHADDYDHLVDSPVDVGKLDRYSFAIQGVPIHIIVDGAHRNYDAAELVSVLERIVAGHVDLMRDIPFDHFYFLYHFTRKRSGGGMEHRDSTAIHRTFSPDERSVQGVIGVSSHEFFHLWNVKRIRPQDMEPIDYFKEDYSTALWFSEGFTSYYGGLILTRVKLQSRQQYYKALARQVGTLQSRSGRQKLSAAHASLLTWFDDLTFFNTAENSFSYYNKGLLIGLLLDLKIREATDNQFSLDDVMRHLNENYAKRGRYFEEDYGVASAITEVTGLDLDDIYTDFVHRKVELPYPEYLAYAGLELVERTVEGERTDYEIREIQTPNPKQLEIRESWLTGR